MKFVELPSGRHLNMDRVIEVVVNDAIVGSHRIAVDVVTDSDGGGRCFYDDDAEMIISVITADNPIDQINARLALNLRAASALGRQMAGSADG